MASKSKSDTPSQFGSMADMPGAALLGQWATGPFEWWNAASDAKPAESPMEMWISMFPASPYFGVKWMFQDAADSMKDMATNFAGDMADVFSAKAANNPFASHLTPLDEKTRLSGADLGDVLQKGATLKGKGKASQVVEQGDEENETVAVDVKKAMAAAAPKKKAPPKAKPVAVDSEARAASEKATLNSVSVAGLSDRSAMGGVSASFKAEVAKPADKKKADLRVVGGSDAPAEAPAAAPKKPKGLLTKKPAKVDDLKLIRGVGPRLEKLLNEAGVYQFKQVAKFTDQDFAWLDDKLSTFKGRGLRDKWREQATELMKG